MYKIESTNDGYMVLDTDSDMYVNDEDGNNLFDSLHEAQKLMTIARMRDAIANLYDAVVEGDAESIAHLSIRYNNLFEGVVK